MLGIRWEVEVDLGNSVDIYIILVYIFLVYKCLFYVIGIS